MRIAADPWVLVLAGGAGTRLRSLTTGVDGIAVPKQFCSLRGGRSLLGDTVARAAQLTSRDRVLVVVAAEHARWWRPQLCALPPANVIVQPCRRGTAAGILLPLRVLLERDPDGVLVVMPSDHGFADPHRALATLGRAVAAVHADRRHAVLLGIEPDGPDPEYGWIVPVGPRGGLQSVRRFVEKPDPAHATALWQAGALWNSFLFAAEVRNLWQLCQRHVPAVATALDQCFAQPGAARAAALAAGYAALPEADFSRQVLQDSCRRLRVLAATGCGWTDLGTPRRVMQWVAGCERAEARASDDGINLAAAVRRFLTGGEAGAGK
jgi:mannose-1-phosphate guanylyltransferase